jgi:hypothetical protein
MLIQVILCGSQGCLEKGSGSKDKNPGSLIIWSICLPTLASALLSPSLLTPPCCPPPHPQALVKSVGPALQGILGIEDKR